MVEIIFQFLLFLLSFLISYGFLRKSKILPKTTNIIVSIIIAFYFLFASIFYGEDIIFIIALSTFLLILGFIVILIYKGIKEKKV